MIINTGVGIKFKECISIILISVKDYIKKRQIVYEPAYDKDIYMLR